MRPGGRIVAWSEFGDEAGLPLLRVPGTPGCRYSLRADRGPWTRRHLRVITTERPGFGASTRLPGRGFGEPADDLAAVLDHLGLEAVHVMGGSGSAPHQLAFAARHPDRVRAMTVLVGAAPCTGDEARQMIGLNADAHELVQKGDVAGLRGLMEPLRAAMLDDPMRYFGPGLSLPSCSAAVANRSLRVRVRCSASVLSSCSRCSASVRSRCLPCSSSALSVSLLVARRPRYCVTTVAISVRTPTLAAMIAGTT